MDQDWKPIVFRPKKSVVNVHNNNKSAQGSKKDIHQISKSGISPKIANNFDPDNMSSPLKSNRSLGITIMNARTNKKLSQRELDNLCMFPKNTISKYENGKAIINHNQLNKLEKELGVKLPRVKNS